MKSSLPRQRIDVDQYHRMAGEGLLAPDARVELIDGEIIDMPPIGSLHAAIVGLLDELFQRAVGNHAIVSAQGPLRLTRFSEVQPDLQLLARRSDRYRAVQPGPSDVFLLIEVSGSTLKFDRSKKVPLFARHAIPEVWIVDTEDARIELYGSLKGGRYQRVRTTGEPGVVSPVLLPQIRVDLADLFRH